MIPLLTASNAVFSFGHDIVTGRAYSRIELEEFLNIDPIFV
jgi:hypothetical protein